MSSSELLQIIETLSSPSSSNCTPVVIGVALANIVSALYVGIVAGATLRKVDVEDPLLEHVVEIALLV